MNEPALEPPGKAQKCVDFYFDLSSPYSYLAATQLEPLAARNHALVQWKPIVLASVFKNTGNVMPAACAPKAAYMFADLSRWAAHYGVPFRFNSRFPINALRAMRLIVAAGLASGAETGHAALSQALFHAAWADDADLTDDAVLRAITQRLGLSPDPLLSACDTQPVKDRLRAFGDEALARGVFGAPSLFVGDELFWGNDRLDFVEAALRRG
jgi:2-hydroxychromene-2-carboxylate isomerase